MPSGKKEPHQPHFFAKKDIRPAKPIPQMNIGQPAYDYKDKNLNERRLDIT